MTVNETKGLAFITCRKCDKTQSSDCYYLTPSGYPRRVCITCMKQYQTDRKAWEQAGEDAAYWRNQRYLYKIRTKFNMTRDQYTAKMESQNFVCAICHEKETTKNTERLSIDHDRACCPETVSCGKCVRGLLCRKCNASLGGFKDSPELLRRAAKYLEEWKASHERERGLHMEEE